MPGLKLTQALAERSGRDRESRAREFGRARTTPTDSVVHALGRCTPRNWGWRPGPRRSRPRMPGHERLRLRTRRFEDELLGLGQPFRPDPAAPGRTLWARPAKHSAELFVFVAQPEVPSDNTAAERSLRHLVTCRKISGGPRSDQGTATKLTLSSLFGTWALQGLDPLAQRRRPWPHLNSEHSRSECVQCPSRGSHQCRSAHAAAN